MRTFKADAGRFRDTAFVESTSHAVVDNESPMVAERSTHKAFEGRFREPTTNVPGALAGRLRITMIGRLEGKRPKIRDRT